ncbi:hypothetical protein GCM10027448_10380 [Nocardioides dilutus]
MAIGCLALLVGCTPADDPADVSAPPTPTPSPTPTSVATVPPEPESSAKPETETERVSADDVRPRTAMRAVHRLADVIGPRPGTSPAFHRSAAWVERRLRALGWEVEQQPFQTPAGVSWGVPVPAGRSVNVVATRGDVVPGRPWLVVGAHLDTVPQAPGAEDNASGVGVLLALAEATADRRTRLPLVLVAFGSEEPRGPSDDDHHYGSRAYVAGLSPAERRSLRGMLSLDRVGVGDVVPVGSAAEPDAQHARVLRAARRVGVPTATDPFQRSSDHWSFVRAGLPGVRLGGTPYPGYHSAGDRSEIIDPHQLARVALIVVAWLR